MLLSVLEGWKMDIGFREYLLRIYCFDSRADDDDDPVCPSAFQALERRFYGIKPDI